ncbi:ionotropic receptor 21a [Chelonus insularis]|uniref:ionotropic receptor 21a n=1 Tax=Chelonus insularis TaxID=460826 RepID=UPI00158D9960|nr:ionotropic receptor 21a [Chelonus insularis]
MRLKVVTSLLRRIFQKSANTSFIQQYLDINKTITPSTIRNKCYHYMIFLDDIYTLNDVIEKEMVNKVLIISESTPWTVKEYLKSPASRSYLNILIITHSMSKKTEESSYLLYTHKLFADGSGGSLSVLLTSWMNNKTTNQVNFFPKKFTEGFKRHRLQIAMAHRSPFAIRTNVISQSRIDWDGIDVRVLKLVTETLNITADFCDPVTSNSPIYAAITDVITGKTAAAAGGIYKTNNITSQFDSSISHIEDCATFISSSSLALPKYRAVMGPFQPAVWIMVCLVYFLVIIPLTMNTNYTLLSLLIHPSRFLDMFWFVFSTFTNSFIVKNPLTETGYAKNSTSLLIGIYWIFTIIITSCYTGSIMAFITVPQFPNALDTIEQLLDEGFEVGTLDHDGWEEWFNWTKIDDSTAAELLKSLKYVPTVQEGVRNASHSFFWSYAFLGSKIVLDYIVQKEFTPNWSTMRSSMHITEECLMNFGVTFVLTKDSVYTNPVDTVIIRAREAGLIQKIMRDVEWDIQRTEEGLHLPISEEYKHRKITIHDRKLELDDTQGMFLVLGAGILIASLALLIECVVHIFRKKFSGNFDTRTSMESNITMPQTSFLEVLEPWDLRSSSNLRPQRFSRSSI